MKYYNLDDNKLYTKEQAIKIEEEKIKEVCSLEEYADNLDIEELWDIIKQANLTQQIMQEIEKDYNIYCEDGAKDNLRSWHEYEVNESKA